MRVLFAGLGLAVVIIILHEPWFRHTHHPDGSPKRIMNGTGYTVKKPRTPRCVAGALSAGGCSFPAETTTRACLITSRACDRRS